MKLELKKIELCEIELPLVHRFETSFGTETGRRILLVRVSDESGADGWGECTAMNHPFYNHETIDTAWSIITCFIAPLLKAKNISQASETSEALKQIQGNR